MKSISRSLATLALAASAAVAGCEVKDPLEGVNLRLDVRDQPVQANAVMAVRQGQGSATGANVSVGADIEEITELKRIQVKPEWLSFSSGINIGLGGLSTLSSGTIDIGFLVGGVPVPGTPIRVTVVNDVVTAIEPTTIDFDGVTYDKAAIEALIESVPQSERPTLPSSWGSLTAEEAVALISESLASENIELTLVAFSGDLSGSLRLEQFTIDAQVAAALE